MFASLDTVNGFVFVPQLRDSEVERYQPCSCCPYGYHIDLDFVRYCEALSHGYEFSTSKQKRRERRRQRHSMDVLLGLANPSLWKIDQLPEEVSVSHDQSYPAEQLKCIQDNVFEDTLSKAVEVFEDTFQKTQSQNELLNTDYRSEMKDGDFQNHWTSKQQNVGEHIQSEISVCDKHRRHPCWTSECNFQQNDITHVKQVNNHVGQNDCDMLNIGNVTSSASTLQIHPELQNIREQMAVSLERMRELEEQVKLIPILQIQLAILKEEKRKLLLMQKLQEHDSKNTEKHHKEDDNRTMKKCEINIPCEEVTQQGQVQDHDENGISGVDEQLALSKLSSSQKYIQDEDVETKCVKTTFRNKGITCSVITRDVGVSHLHPKTKSIGTNTIESKKMLTFSGMRRENILPDFMSVNTITECQNIVNFNNNLNDDSNHIPLFTPLPCEENTPIAKRNVSIVTDLLMTDLKDLTKLSPITGKTSKSDVSSPDSPAIDLKSIIHAIEQSDVSVQVSEDNILPLTDRKHKSVTCLTSIGVQCYNVVMKHEGIQSDVNVWQSTQGTQCNLRREHRDAWIQVSRSEKSTIDVGFNIKPRTNERGVDAKVVTWDKSTTTSSVNSLLCNKCSIISPIMALDKPERNEDNLRNISLSSLNDTSNSRFSNSAVEKAVVATSNIACGNDWIFSTSRSTDTNDLHFTSKKDVGCNTIHKQLEDVEDVISQSSEKLKEKLNGERNFENFVTKDANSVECFSMSQSRIPRLTVPVSSSGYSHIKYGHSNNLQLDKPQKTVSTVTCHHRSPSASISKYTSKKISPTTSPIQEKSQELGSNVRHQLQRQSTYSKLPEVSEIYSEEVGSRKTCRAEPTKEMKAALKVINDYLKKNPFKNDLPKHLTNATNITQQEWFKVSGGKAVNPLTVEDYLDYIEGCSTELLEYVVNMTDISGNTALHYAVSSGNFDVVSILLDSKVCNVNKRNAAGYTCVMLATLVKLRSETHRQIIRRMFLLADVNIKAKPHGQTALMLATSHGSLEMVQMLTEAGADVNIQDADGSTALMCAADHGFIDIVKHIISQPDCDVTLTDSDGCTALNIAMESDNRHVGFLLYAHQHFSQGNSPNSSVRSKRSRSSTPTSRSNTLLSCHSGETPVPSEMDTNQQ